MIVVGSKRLTITEFEQIIFENQKIEIDTVALNRVNENYLFLKEFSQNKVIYGINTGFGPMAQYKIDSKELINLQFNLIRSHSAGAGDLLSDKCVKSAMLARLNTLLQAYSGVNKSVVILLAQFINNNIYPNIYKHGGVGASGDLVQLSHLALALIGEGEVIYKNESRKTADVLKELNLKPIDIKIREGLALINGTSVMTGINMLNTIYARRLLNWSVFLSTMLNEIVKSYDDHFSLELNNVKHHKGQQYIAQVMRNMASSSKLVKKRQDFLYKQNDNSIKVFEDKVQEYYSLRCVPQILGPIWDTLNYAENILEDEINSVNDNPIIDHKNNNVFHGGNFHGDYVALEADKIKIVISKLSMLAERQINFLMNEKINKILPPFINLGTLGLNLGMQGVQFTAVSTTAENQTLSNPMYIHSIPNNNDNQDIVSMGTNASLLARKVIFNTFEVIAIQAISMVQAVDYLQNQEFLSSKSNEIYNEIRKIVPRFEKDTPKYLDIRNVKNYLTYKDLNLL